VHSLGAYGKGGTPVARERRAMDDLQWRCAMRQQLGMLLMTVSDLAFIAGVVYVAKHPQPKGEPYGREHKLLWTSLFVSFCCTIAAGFAMFVPSVRDGRPLAGRLLTLAAASGDGSKPPIEVVKEPPISANSHTRRSRPE
jgi:hypothetical protein